MTTNKDLLAKYNDLVKVFKNYYNDYRNKFDSITSNYIQTYDFEHFSNNDLLDLRDLQVNYNGKLFSIKVDLVKNDYKNKLDQSKLLDPNTVDMLIDGLLKSSQEYITLIDLIIQKRVKESPVTKNSYEYLDTAYSEKDISEMNDDERDYLSNITQCLILLYFYSIVMKQMSDINYMRRMSTNIQTIEDIFNKRLFELKNIIASIDEAKKDCLIGIEKESICKEKIAKLGPDFITAMMYMIANCISVMGNDKINPDTMGLNSYVG